MKNFKRLLAFTAAMALIGSMTACGNSSTPAETTATTAPKELDEEDKAAVAEVDIGEDEKLENGTIKWLATYDINPDLGKPKMFALELFESKYGGKVEWIPTTCDYLDFDSDLWSDGCKKLAELHTIGGKHYVAPVATDSKCVMIYNKKTIEEN